MMDVVRMIVEEHVHEVVFADARLEKKHTESDGEDSEEVFHKAMSF